MLKKKELKMCKLLINMYNKKLNKYIKNNTKLNAESICNEYIERFYKYMNNVDLGENNGKFTSYLNIFSGLCAYEILREKGLSEKQGINAYNEMCAGVRKFASILYKMVDLLPMLKMVRYVIIQYYNLDMIISVGYRVNSKQGIAFREWATNILKDYTLKGYAVNQKRLDHLEKTIKLIDIANRIDERLEGDDAKEILKVIGEYSKALNLLDDFVFKIVSYMEI